MRDALDSLRAAGRSPSSGGARKQPCRPAPCPGPRGGVDGAPQARGRPLRGDRRQSGRAGAGGLEARRVVKASVSRPHWRRRRRLRSGRPTDLAAAIAGRLRRLERGERDAVPLGDASSRGDRSAGRRCGSCRCRCSARRAWRGARSRPGRALGGQRPALGLGAPGVVADEPVTAHDAMAGDEDGDRVVAERRAHRPDRLRSADLAGQPCIRPDLARRDGQRALEDVGREGGQAAQVEGQAVRSAIGKGAARPVRRCLTRAASRRGSPARSARGRRPRIRLRPQVGRPARWPRRRDRCRPRRSVRCSHRP